MVVEWVAMSVFSKLATLELYESAATALTAIQPRHIDLLGVREPADHILSIPEPPVPPTEPILLNLISL
ncbi:hypothetical protein CPC08DRAFT_770248 [Agrocybe pediades]|nr:hypothetical protein CPC08DRAFT_770248 [Agrocybe pediades]